MQKYQFKKLLNFNIKCYNIVVIKMKLDLNNAMLTRAYKNYIPQNKVLKPSCEEKYLNYEITSDYKDVIRKIFIKEYEKKHKKVLNIWNDDDHKIINEGIKFLLPLSSTYVSTLSFSINGLVHDDTNNFFSSYNVCILEPLKYHLNDNFLNFNVNDTTIKGSITLSDEAMILINKEYYNTLTKEEKENLRQIYKIYIFEGPLKEAVNKVLQENNYPSLNLINQKKSKYIEDSEVKESALEFINSFAKENHLSKLRLFDIYTSPFLENEADITAASKVKDEAQLIYEIKIYYRNKFYEYLLDLVTLYGLDLNDTEKYYLMSKYANSKKVLEKIVTYLVEKLGFDKYQEIIEKYNKHIIENYESNEKIINSAICRDK